MAQCHVTFEQSLRFLKELHADGVRNGASEDELNTVISSSAYAIAFIYNMDAAHIIMRVTGIDCGSLKPFKPEWYPK